MNVTDGTTFNSYYAPTYLTVIMLCVRSTFQDHLMFPRMLMKLVSLRTLSSVHSEQVFALRLQDKKLPPLLSEIWDVHEWKWLLQMARPKDTVLTGFMAERHGFILPLKPTNCPRLEEPALLPSGLMIVLSCEGYIGWWSVFWESAL